MKLSITFWPCYFVISLSSIQWNYIRMPTHTRCLKDRNHGIRSRQPSRYKYINMTKVFALEFMMTTRRI